MNTVLFIVVLVPSATLVPLLGSGDYQLFTQWRTEKRQVEQARDIEKSAIGLFFSLEQERTLTEEVLADIGKTARERLADQRAVTDRAVNAFRLRVTSNTLAADPRQGLADAIQDTTQGLNSLARQRSAADTRSSSSQQSFLYYSGVLESVVGVFGELGDGGKAEVAELRHTLADLLTVLDMTGRERALLAGGQKSGRLTSEEHRLVLDAVSTGTYLLRTRVAPRLPDEETALYRTMTTSRPWQVRAALEKQVAATETTNPGQSKLARDIADLRSSAGVITPQLLRLVQRQSDNADQAATRSVQEIRTFFIAVSMGGLFAIGLIVLTSWRLTAVLRRRILQLRETARDLSDRLPDMVVRLARGDDVDVEAEVRPVPPTPDELGALGEALNLAMYSAVSAAVRQAEQHRGFERLLQRVARRTQILIGLQMKKLDELEHKHDDPAVLEGLFDLDHLTARLRRYEESLVILAGGQPHRRWHKPAPLLDVLRSAQSEVQDYRRISIDIQDETKVRVTEGAIGPLIHILAELMENAAAFSKPPTPVEVRVTAVSQGIAVEIEDRGLGMETHRYVAANALMTSPPHLDVMTHADDARLGLYVVARLAAGQDLRVDLRPSAFGGTRVVVLLPKSLLADRSATATPSAVPARGASDRFTGLRPHPRDAGPRAHAEDDQAARSSDPSQEQPARRGSTQTDRMVPPAASSVPDTPDSVPGRRPLPRRIRHADLPAEPRDLTDLTDHVGHPPMDHDRISRSSATIGAFQRISRGARTTTDVPSPQSAESAEPTAPTTGDRK
ncbi:nitrate- and nitrite sensing domain-containing protein [Streptomyces sp900105245]|uniref:histidine kinase n=1 Tax=Streptomyces sp. 900105245 TaxID=3154379 RepID=A0ABV1ULB2_9ACTN